MWNDFPKHIWKSVVNRLFSTTQNGTNIDNMVNNKEFR